MHTSSEGFTLIELLVVIAIIGILSAVVLASLNTARNKGSDAAIQSNLGTIRSQAEIYRDGPGNNAYGANPALESSCIATDTMFSGSLPDSNINRAAAAANKINNNNVTCNVAALGTEYAVFARLVSDPTTYWCVDSASVGRRETTVAIGSNLTTLTSCP